MHTHPDNMHIIVSDAWLKACGMMKHSGKALEVISIRDFGRRGKLYEVMLDNPYLWEVFDWRGITIVSEIGPRGIPVNCPPYDRTDD